MITEFASHESLRSGLFRPLCQLTRTEPDSNQNGYLPVYLLVSTLSTTATHIIGSLDFHQTCLRREADQPVLTVYSTTNLHIFSCVATYFTIPMSRLLYNFREKIYVKLYNSKTIDYFSYM